MSSFVQPEAGAQPETGAQPEAGAPVRYRIRHASAYRYGNDIMLAHHLLHLTPRPVLGQAVASFSLNIEPPASVLSEHVDFFGNPTTYLELHDPHLRLTVVAETDIEVTPPSSPGTDIPWEDLRDRVLAPADPAARNASAFAYASPMVAFDGELRDYALESFTPGRSIRAAALDLNQRIHDEFTFDATATTIATPIAEVFADRRGVCQDFAHLAIGCARSLGLAARYVSGYLRTLPPPGRPRPVGADVSHAWLSVWCGGEDWLDLDPTNGRVGSTDLITLAWGRDYGDVSPLQGVILGSSIQHLTVSVDVTELSDPG